MTVIDDILDAKLNLDSLSIVGLREVARELNIRGRTKKELKELILTEVYTHIDPTVLYNLPIPQNARLATLLTYYSELMIPSVQKDFFYRVVAGELEPLDRLSMDQLEAISQYLNIPVCRLTLDRIATIREKLAKLDPMTGLQYTDNFDVTDEELGL